jgi:REP element-mobilizing transposase RayT
LTGNIDLLRRAVSEVKNELPFELVAVVVLPEHLHCVWTLQAGDADYPLRWKRQGLYPEDWADGGSDIGHDCGERE